MLAHDNLHFTTSTATIKGECPFMNCTVSFDATVWSPRVGMKLGERGRTYCLYIIWLINTTVKQWARLTCARPTMSPSLYIEHSTSQYRDIISQRTAGSSSTGPLRMTPSLMLVLPMRMNLRRMRLKVAAAGYIRSLATSWEEKVGSWSSR